MICKPLRGSERDKCEKLNKKELKRWKNVHDLLTEINVGRIEADEKIRDKGERIKEAKERAKQHWKEFKEEW